MKKARDVIKATEGRKLTQHIKGWDQAAVEESCGWN